MPDLYLEEVKKFFASGKPYVLLLICVVFIIVLLIPTENGAQKERMAKPCQALRYRTGRGAM